MEDGQASRWLDYRSTGQLLGGKPQGDCLFGGPRLAAQATKKQRVAGTPLGSFSAVLAETHAWLCRRCGCAATQEQPWTARWQNGRDGRLGER